MPDLHMPDHVIEDLRCENARLRHELSELTAKYNTLLNSSAQTAKDLVRVSAENYKLLKQFSGN